MYLHLFTKETNIHRPRLEDVMKGIFLHGRGMGLQPFKNSMLQLANLCVFRSLEARKVHFLKKQTIPFNFFEGQDCTWEGWAKKLEQLRGFWQYCASLTQDKSFHFQVRNNGATGTAQREGLGGL